VCGGAATFSTPPISAPKQLDPLAKRDEVTQYAATIFEQVLADGGQDKAAPNTIKKPEPKLLLEIADLSR